MPAGPSLKTMIATGPMVVAPGAYDCLTAQLVEQAGFPAVYMTGAGTSVSHGLPDYGLLTMTEMVANAGRMAATVGVPLVSDADTGYGNELSVYRTVQEFERAGVAAIHIEDQVFPKRCGHMEGKEVIPAAEMAGKIRACAEARDRLDRDFVLNARTDACAPLGLDEAIRRCNLYLEAGADLAFIDGIRTKADIQRAVKEVKGPLSVNLMDAVSGVKTELVPIPELARMGVGRVSIPVASIMVVHKALSEFFKALKASPTGTLPGETKWVTSFAEYTQAVGLPEYRALEEKYLPKERFETKYQKLAKLGA